MFCFQNSQHPATSINASCCIQYCVDVFSAGAMLVVLNRAPKGKLSIVLKAPVEASMLFLTGSTKMNFPPKTSPSIEVKWSLFFILKQGVKKGSDFAIFWTSATEVEKSTLFESEDACNKMLVLRFETNVCDRIWNIISSCHKLWFFRLVLLVFDNARPNPQRQVLVPVVSATTAGSARDVLIPVLQEHRWGLSTKAHCSWQNFLKAVFSAFWSTHSSRDSWIIW